MVCWHSWVLSIPPAQPRTIQMAHTNHLVCHVCCVLLPQASCFICCRDFVEHGGPNSGCLRKVYRALVQGVMAADEVRPSSVELGACCVLERVVRGMGAGHCGRRRSVLVPGPHLALPLSDLCKLPMFLWKRVLAPSCMLSPPATLP